LSLHGPTIGPTRPSDNKIPARRWWTLPWTWAAPRLKGCQPTKSLRGCRVQRLQKIQPPPSPRLGTSLDFGGASSRGLTNAFYRQYNSWLQDGVRPSSLLHVTDSVSCCTPASTIESPAHAPIRSSHATSTAPGGIPVMTILLPCLPHLFEPSRLRIILVE
jgi:hypothetical protein